MREVVVAFIAFYGLASYLLSGGGDIDMDGPTHGTWNAPAAVELTNLSTR